MHPDRNLKARLGVEIGLEATRNPRIGEIYKRFDDEVKENFERLFHRLEAEGLIAPAMDIPSLADAVGIIADGMFWRYAIRNDNTLPLAFALIERLLNPLAGSGPANSTPTSKAP
jgi:AcrR family transcriptional regulator